MSIASSIAAEYGNNIKEGWTKRLREAIANKDLLKIAEIVEEMEKFYFSE